MKFNLGKVNVKLGAYSNAITWFEEYLDFVKGKQDNEGLVLGSRKLLEVTRTLYDSSCQISRKWTVLCGALVKITCLPYFWYELCKFGVHIVCGMSKR